MPDIVCKIHLKSSPEQVFTFLSTDKGREKFWAEHSREADGHIEFTFINGWRYKSKILNKEAPGHFEVEYFNSLVSFRLSACESGGTDLTLLNTRVPEAEYHEVYAGWVSVLMALKGAADFGIDLRNHQAGRTWDDKFVDN